MSDKIVRMICTGGQFRITIPREIAIESDLYMSEFVEVKTIEKGKLEVKGIELRKAREKGIPANSG